MSIPDYQSLMLPVLVASSKGDVGIAAAVEQLADQLGLAPEERSKLLPSGKQTVFSNRVNWAKTFLRKAQLVEMPRRGYFRITPRGQTVLESHPAKIDDKFLMQFEEFRQFREASSGGEEQGGQPAIPSSESQEKTPDEAIRLANWQIEADLRQDLLDRVRKAPPAFFERLIVSLLLEMGYGGSRADEPGRILGGSGDGGVDGVIDQDAFGLDRVYIQAKRYAPGNSIGSGAIRDFFGSLDHHKAAKGLFVTTSTFSPSAKETAESLSRRIVLVDGEQLAGLMVKHNIGCRIEETLYIKRVDEEFFDG